MEFRHVSESPSDSAADLVVVPVHGDLAADTLWKALDKAAGGALSAAASDESFSGKSGKTLMVSGISGLSAKRYLFVGAGEKKDFSMGSLRDLGAQAVKAGGKVSATKVSLVLPAGVSSRATANAVQLSVEGAALGTYNFNRYLTSKESKKVSSVKDFAVNVDPRGKKLKAADSRALGASVSRGQIVAKATAHARDMINEPAQYMTPEQVAAEARAVAKTSPQLTCTVLGVKECEKLGMGMFLAVGRGSDNESKFIHMVYKPKKAAKRRVALVGKGVTFDSGGYSLKPSNAMEDMKIDMSGSAAVISAMEAIAAIGSECEVHAIAACCENLVSGRAYKLGDVLTAMDGTTVEINNTDAEGRLTLGDAITFAREKVKADEIFDFATLTGACMVALGNVQAGVMSDDEKLVKAWLSAQETACEDSWRLPLHKGLKDQLKSPLADMKNTGDRFGGAITAGLFLQHFAKDTPWVHVDIAGPAATSTARPATPKGGVGYAVASIVEYLTR